MRSKIEDMEKNNKKEDKSFNIVGIVSSVLIVILIIVVCFVKNIDTKIKYIYCDMGERCQYDDLYVSVSSYEFTDRIYGTYYTYQSKEGCIFIMIDTKIENFSTKKIDFYNYNDNDLSASLIYKDGDKDIEYFPEIASDDKFITSHSSIISYGYIEGFFVFEIPQNIITGYDISKNYTEAQNKNLYFRFSYNKTTADIIEIDL